MFRSFDEIEEFVLSQGTKKKIALAAAHDMPALSAAVEAKNKGVAELVFIGKSAEICEMLKELGKNPDEYKIIECEDDAECAKIAVEMVRNGEADLPMKGILQSSTFIKALLNKEYGLVPPGGLISQAAVFKHPEEDRLVTFTDSAINIAPTKEDKVKILKNALPVAKSLGIEVPKVAMISAVEKVSPKMISTVDAAEIAEEGVEGCIIQGPLSVDGAISKERAKHKGISGAVAGSADILVMPNICASNVFYKCLTCVAKQDIVSLICGATAPVIITSRADEPKDKYNSILFSVFQCIKR